MQLCAGATRAKHTVHILMLNTIDALVSAVCFYFFGFGFAFGAADDGGGNTFIGNLDFALMNSGDTHWHLFFFHWAVVAAVVTITAGGMAERMRVEAYLLYAVYMSTLVYPIVAHWCDACTTAAAALSAASADVVPLPELPPATCTLECRLRAGCGRPTAGSARATPSRCSTSASLTLRAPRSCTCSAASLRLRATS